jgi:Na+/H+-translocating membrane pyrophosphatase
MCLAFRLQQLPTHIPPLPYRCCLRTQVALGLALTSLPETFELPVPSRTQGKEYDFKTVKNWYMFVCVAAGLWGGLAIGLQTEYFTSNRYRPVQVRGCSKDGGSSKTWTYEAVAAGGSCAVYVFFLF